MEKAKCIRTNVVCSFCITFLKMYTHVFTNIYMTAFNYTELDNSESDRLCEVELRDKRIGIERLFF